MGNMKLAFKAIAAAIALAGAPNAFAAMALSGQADVNNGQGADLLFFVYNTDTNQSYVRDLGVRAGRFGPTSNPVPTSGFTYDISTPAPNGTSTFPGLYNSTSNQTPGYNVSWTDSTLASLFGGSFTSANT